MTLLPNRTVASQVSAQLRESISQGLWREWLPAERELCKKLQVGRDTLRTALAELTRERIISVQHGVGYKVASKPLRSARREAPRTIGMLAPEPLNRLRPNDLLWIDDLKVRVQTAGFELQFYHGHSYYRSKHGQALQRLVRRHPQTAWVLLLAKEPMQRWFKESGLPCVIAGSGIVGIDLPTVDLDYRAICRHAVNTLVRAGHRDIVLFNHRSHIGGDLASEIGVKEAAQELSGSVQATVVYHNEDLESVGSAVRQMFARPTPPTGIIVANSSWYVSTLTALAKIGLSVPEDVSLVSRDDDGFLDYLIPPPARYLNNPRTFAKKILAQALRVAGTTSTLSINTRIVPQFFPGGSVAAPGNPRPRQPRANPVGRMKER